MKLPFSTFHKILAVVCFIRYQAKNILTKLIKMYLIWIGEPIKIKKTSGRDNKQEKKTSKIFTRENLIVVLTFF